MKYAHYKTTGQILGFYDDGIHESIPKPNLQLTDEQWQDCVEHQGARAIDINTREVVDYVAPPPPLNELKSQVRLRVQTFSADARTQLIGKIDPYKLVGWQEKLPRAQRVLAGTASEADLEIIQAEIDQRGMDETPEQLAEKQLSKSEAQAKRLAFIEGMEAAALSVIDKAESANALEAFWEEFEAEAATKIDSLV